MPAKAASKPANWPGKASPQVLTWGKNSIQVKTPAKMEKIARLVHQASWTLANAATRPTGPPATVR